MTILDRGSNSKNKEENAQARQSNLDNGNSNRKQRTRTNHPTRTDRGLSHGLNVPAASNIDSTYRANYWDDSSSPTSHHSPEYVDPPHIQISHNEINIHGHIKPRGLSKSSSVVQSPNPESLHVMSEPSAVEDISHASNIAATIDSVHAVSYSAKNLSRVKKTTEKKIYHKKKRRNMPYQTKITKAQEKLASQQHRAKLLSKASENKLQSGASNILPRPYSATAFLAQENAYNNNMELANRFRTFSEEKTDFKPTRDTTVQYTKKVPLFPQCDIPNSPSGLLEEKIVAAERTVYGDHNSEGEEVKHNSDDEHDHSRLKRLHKGIDFDKIESEFEEKLKKTRGFTIKLMEEDGACLFRAVADQVYGDQGMHDEVRKNCMNYMNKNADYFKNYVTEDFEAYINRKRDVHEFGNHLEMQAMAELYSRPFEVYQYSTDPINTFQSSNSSANVPIRVSYHKNSHYNSVIDPFAATIGVGLGLPSFTPGLVDKNMLNDAVKASCEVWEQQMLNDKVQATDWENTDDAILKQVARESYIAFLEHNTSDVPGKNDRKTPEKSPNEEKQFEKSPKSRVVKEFPKKTNKTAAHSASDWVAEEDEWEVLSQVLANSQQEYMDVLKHQATHSKATCSKYT